MKRLKRAVIRYVNRIAKHTEMYATIERIKHRLETTTHLQYLITPEILPLSEKAGEIFQAINVDATHSGTNLTISKNDLMFLFWLHQTGSVDKALAGYFQSGLTQIDIIGALLERHFGGPENIAMLDFASGHGRVSRYLKNILPSQQVVVADIKRDAVLFQKETFGYDGFLAPSDPSAMKYEGRFNFILASSLFTHLNETLFGQWLTALGNLLGNNGILAVSLHLLAADYEDFWYTEISEDDLFPETVDTLSGKRIYGLTHLTRQAFVKILKESLGEEFEIIDEQDWAGSQVLFSIKRVDNAYKS